MSMFYISACVAIVGAVGYQYFVKRVPATLNPMVSVGAMYVLVLVFSIGYLTLFPVEGGLRQQFRQLGWLQLALAASVIMIELGFLLMYRNGWDLSTGNLVTGAIISVILVGLGVILLGERMNLVNAIGIVLCILGVALISYRA